jgi:ubiquitin C-terminal hydrolase
MFGLTNHRGSCWVNAALQGLFSSPPLVDRYAERENIDKENPIDVCLESIYRNQGTTGLREFFDVIKTSYLPAGENIGDSHELIVHLCDKLPWLDKEFRFQVGDRIECNNCHDTQLKTDTVIDLNLMPSKPGIALFDAIQEHVVPHVIPEWKCEKCEKTGCTKQVLFGTFPKVMMIWSMTPIDYSSLLVLNGKKYFLFSVICFNGGHWFSYARKLPPGHAWYVLDDTNVREMDSKKFPVDRTMRVLLYFLYEN